MKTLIAFLLGLLTLLLGAIGAKVWEGVELSKENAIHREHQAFAIEALRSEAKGLNAEVKGLRHDLDMLWRDTSELAKETQ